MDLDKLFSGTLAALRTASPAIAAAPAFQSLVGTVLAAFNGDQRQDQLKAAYAAARGEADAAQHDFQNASKGR